MGKLSYSRVASTLALVVALGTGGAYAANELGKNDVKSKHIRNGGVKTKDLANNAVTSPKVANGSLLGEDFADGQLPQGPQGPQGEQGLQGAEGPSGTARAFARVWSHAFRPCAPTCSADHAKGVSQVTRLRTGNYCVRVPGLDSSQIAPVVSVEWFTTNGPEGNTSALVHGTSECPTASDFHVVTERQPIVNVRNADNSAQTSVSGLAETADNVSFTIIVP